MYKYKLISVVLMLFFFSNIFFSFDVYACKDIIACGDATEGDYNLLLKVRDPSRPGLQVLCIVPEGYKYTYRYPWNGKPFDFTVSQKFIGVATKQDVIPNIVKAGMSLSAAGIAYADADTNSNWKNPTKNAWDDFDWIRYACQKANTEEEAVKLLTEDVVKKLHASGVSENLFVVGPEKGYVIEADAFHYKIKELNNGIVAMSNYPKELWKTQLLQKMPISRSFDTTIEKTVRKGQTIRLNSIQGIRVLDIGKDYVTVKPVFIIHALITGTKNMVYKIQLNERKTVGYFSVKLLEINNNKAKISMCNVFKAWEDELLSHIQPLYGDITIKDMINFSRLHPEDLNQLRPMCEDKYNYEAVTIFKIPNKNFNILSSGWFSANHACSSIFVPFHICDIDIYNSYETGEAAELSLNLLKEYGHGTLSNNFSKIEDVFLYETDFTEQIVKTMTSDQKISCFLTQIDTGMQKQAYLTEQIWMKTSSISNEKNKQLIIDILSGIWNSNYSSSLFLMKDSVNKLENISNIDFILDKICEIALDICKLRIVTVDTLGKNFQNAQLEYEAGSNLFKKGEYNLGFDHIEKAFIKCEYLIKGQIIPSANESVKNNNLENAIYFFVIILLVLAVFLFFRLKSFKKI